MDPKTREAVRLFGRLLDDLALERHLTEKGARVDALIELEGYAAELLVMVEGLALLRQEMARVPVDPTEPDLVALTAKVGEDLQESALELQKGVEQSLAGHLGVKLKMSRRRAKRQHLKAVPEVPKDGEG
ncbi:MAG: hypothetical protein SF066_15485 [Thermoanaerobaculia bacterium]|nr:hypothetical protein [Thermoanaerobaculia bacterium]